MQFQWSDFKVYEDGSVSNSIKGVVTFDEGLTLDLRIIDHTRPGQKQKDRKCMRHVKYAYEFMDDLQRGALGYRCCGVDKQEDYTDHFGFDQEPTMTLEDAKRAYERRVCQWFIDQVDYEADLQLFMERLRKRQARREEAELFLNN